MAVSRGRTLLCVLGLVRALVRACALVLVHIASASPGARTISRARTCIRGSYTRVHSYSYYALRLSAEHEDS